jgi:hypothetical protein
MYWEVTKQTRALTMQLPDQTKHHKDTLQGLVVRVKTMT